MGNRGTDVAREASSIVLLDDDFGSIVKAITLGRRIYDNIRKAMAFIFAVHVPIAGFALGPLLIGMPLLFGPIHIALLEMVIDPVCAFVFEAEEDESDIMTRPPRAPDEKLFSWGMIIWSIFQGGVSFVLLAGVYAFAIWKGYGDAQVRTLVFFALVASILSLIIVNRSFEGSIFGALRRQNRALIYVLASVVFISSAILLIPVTASLLEFASLRIQDLAIVIVTAASSILPLQFMKMAVFK
jgi:Ca2+-transporting ATPase